MAIDPPWRLDPLQTIVDVNWASIIVLVTDFAIDMDTFTDVACGSGTTTFPDGTGPWQAAFITSASFRQIAPTQRHLVAVYKLVPKEVSLSRWQPRPLSEITAITWPAVPAGGGFEPVTHGTQENEGREDLPLGGDLHSLLPEDDREIRAEGTIIKTKIPRITDNPWRQPMVTVSSFWRELSLGPICHSSIEGGPGNQEAVFQGPRVRALTNNWNASLITAEYKDKPYEPFAVSVQSKTLIDGSEAGGFTHILMVPQGLEESA